ncbi:hypothetical protein [Sinorhizobium meliloti]|uniref:hypothetical protein n=1 Tax=Rhizobium meliloti TaxID=382 RepID=UPI001F2D6463|nr:hypothetical protein [Sinorhizobium meliloti]
MAELAAIAGTVGKVAAIGGTLLQVAGNMQAGREQEARFNYEQKVQRQQADEAEAASQRDAAERYREGQFMLSQQRAAIVGSGGSVAEPSVIDLMGDTRERTTLAAQTDMYNGQQQARGYNDAAKIAGINASNAMSAARLRAGASLFAGVSDMYSRFGQQAMQSRTATGTAAPLYG